LRYTGFMRWLRCTILLLALCVAAPQLTGCFGGPSPSEGDLHSDDPAAKLYAIRKAGAQRDTSAVPDLVELLDHDDPAVRIMSIQALERITGERKGYEPYASRAAREPAITRWEQSIHGEDFSHHP